MAHVVDDGSVLSVAHGVCFQRNARSDVAARERVGRHVLFNSRLQFLDALLLV